ncbi:MAG TPA: MmgE/PrpD family protein [Thermoleophilaceae bacterium]|jgi:2-methylcitrate dehydratase PrpD
MALAYRVALLDWLACAVGGAGEPATRAALGAAEGLEGRVAAAGTAGHVLDFDDTYTPGLAHLSAPVAPAAVVLGGELGATVGEVVSAYATGFEAMAQLTRANHPGMRERGWHPTATCGAVGAAAAAAELLELDDGRRLAALRLALLATSGLRAAFGSDGKSLQVGSAAAAGVRAARLAAAGASVGASAERGWEQAYGARWVEPEAAAGAIHANWIKAHPCCLQTHGAIDAALASGASPGDGVEVTVHPVSLTAAEIDDPADGLQAKFSIPYLTAYALMRGAPTVESFRSIDDAVRVEARSIRVSTDASLLESEAVLSARGAVLARVEAAVGSPENPMTAERLAAKVGQLAGGRLDGALDDPSRDAAELARILPGGGHHP